MESEFGAPITENEIETINKNLQVILEYLPEEHVKEIGRNGFWIKKFDELMTRSVNNRACVFVTYEGKIAKCGIEKAYGNGRINFIKPISCHLFPIRVSNLGGPVLRFEKYLECESALEKGKSTGVKVIDFCKDALEREYGKEWFFKIKKEINQ